MRYEKKMLILSGEGKGVVMIEKSGLGVRFALRTFGLKRHPDRKVGIITQSDVFVRDLPDTADPSIVFYLDGAETDTIHFAVFDSELRLYGTNGKRMWEANLMGLLRARDRAGAPPDPLPARLPPIVEKPKTLPLPNGTGLPQSRDAIYGDETLAPADFYTPFNMSERMRIVDGFLDTPRVLNDRPTGGIEYTRLENPSIAAGDAAAYSIGMKSADAVETGAAAEVNTEVEYSEASYDGESEVAGEDTATAFAETVANEPTNNTELEAREAVDENIHYQAESAKAATDPKREAAAALDSPWQYEARFLCKMSNREPIIEKAKVEPIVQHSKVPPLRETAFFERARGDIDKLFAAADRDDELKGLLPDMEWGKVMFDGHTVSVGRTTEFLCYAVAG
ncbi:MAG: hypothetical protein K2M48_01110, partial [Clostridiales bacterium]|nr:hypothetical protein [Clostridiales bacterium]